MLFRFRRDGWGGCHFDWQGAGDCAVCRTRLGHPMRHMTRRLMPLVRSFGFRKCDCRHDRNRCRGNQKNNFRFHGGVSLQTGVFRYLRSNVRFARAACRALLFDRKTACLFGTRKETFAGPARLNFSAIGCGLWQYHASAPDAVTARSSEES